MIMMMKMRIRTENRKKRKGEMEGKSQTMTQMIRANQHFRKEKKSITRKIDLLNRKTKNTLH